MADRYVRAHPRAVLGNPNIAEKMGWELIAVQPDGLLIYRRQRRSWWRRLLRAPEQQYLSW